MEKLELQILWLENCLGLTINQKISKQIIPLTPYYFWPVNEAWEQIRFELDSKSWISKTEKIRILNLVVDTMNYWQENRTLLLKEFKTKTKIFPAKFSDKIVGLP